MSSFANAVKTTKLHSNFKNVEIVNNVEIQRGFIPPRGGSTIIEVQDHILVFGGSRPGESIEDDSVHFNDLIIYKKTSETNPKSVFRHVPSIPLEEEEKHEKFQNTSLKVQSGDIPMPRSGHAVAAYGKYMLLHGGVFMSNKEEECKAYNDLYLFDTESLHWSYVGEAGVEVTKRGSHSMGIVHNADRSRQYLVLYGGSSPEHGVLNDTVFAELPAVEDIDPAQFFVTWQLLTHSRPLSPDRLGLKPTAYDHGREMQGTCTYQGAMYISGGRHGDSQDSERLFDDVWVLRVNENYVCGDGVVPATTNVNVSINAGTGTGIVGDDNAAVAIDSNVTTVNNSNNNGSSNNNNSTIPVTQVPNLVTLNFGGADNNTAGDTTTYTPNNTTTATSTDIAEPLVWSKVSIQLPSGRCTHSMVVIDKICEDGTVKPILVIYGGYGNDLFTDFQTTDLPPLDVPGSRGDVHANVLKGTKWTTLTQKTKISKRIGNAMCSISASMLQNISNNAAYGFLIGKPTAATTTNNNNNSTENGGGSAGVAVLLFSGVILPNERGEMSGDCDLWLVNI